MVWNASFYTSTNLVYTFILLVTGLANATKREVYKGMPRQLDLL